MPGVTKRKYESETVNCEKSLTRPLSLIIETLKPGYTMEELLTAYKYYYPFEWDTICERYRIYKEKDDFLVKMGKKKRYYPKSPEVFFYSLCKVKYMLSDEFRRKHELLYDENRRSVSEKKLKAKREKSVEQKKASVRAYTYKQQKVDPGFIEALVFAYHNKKCDINGKMEICKEIRKYDCNRSWEFFWKINDSERNDQIRRYAFKCLQETGHYVKLRKKYKGKKKQYMIEKSTFEGTPETLSNKLKDNSSIQNMKNYNLFISHSYLDREAVSEVVRNANKLGLNCYVDWTADDDFLKRSLVSDYTKEVLKVRMRQSQRLLYLSSSNSRKSSWVRFELEYYQNVIQKEIIMITLDGNDDHNFKVINKSEMDIFFKEAK